MLSRLPKWVWFGGAALAFAAGMVNAIAFLSFVHQAATHITGIFTHLSLDIYSKNYAATLQSGLALLFFFLGSVLSGILIKDAHLKMGRRYGAALFLECLLLVASTLAFQSKSILGECLACMAAGLQNAMVSTYSGTILRTTHMTGVLTDLGALIGQSLGGIKIDKRKLELLLGILLAFFWGGFWGAFAYTRMDYLAMLLPAGIVGISGFAYLALRKKTLAALSQEQPF